MVPFFYHIVKVFIFPFLFAVLDFIQVCQDKHGTRP
jgi:hypothetical protein